MEYTQLGKSDLKISRISLGCMSLGINYEHAATLLDKALEMGINYWDTADLYDKGENERIVGRFLKGRRDQVVIGTKVGNQWREDGTGWNWNPRKEYIIEAVEKSLGRLGTDYLDLYQLHGGTMGDPKEEVVEAFEKLQAAGKIRWYGISSIRPNVIRWYADHSNMVSVMMQYSLLDRRPEEEALDLLKQKGAGVLVRGAVAKGLLAGTPPQSPYLEHSPETLIRLQHTLQNYAGGRATPGQLAMRYVLDHPAVSSIVAGASKIFQVEENAKAADLMPLSEATRKTLQEAVPAGFYTQHR